MPTLDWIVRIDPARLGSGSETRNPSEDQEAMAIRPPTQSTPDAVRSLGLEPRPIPRAPGRKGVVGCRTARRARRFRPPALNTSPVRAD